MSPVNEYLGPLIERGLRALISEGYLRVVYGSAAEGGYLCSQPGIDAIHMTGSDKTYEAIVFGSGTEGQRRKKQQERLSVKPFTSELGNVAPAIIVPGPWNHADVSYQAEQLASHLCDNASYSCSRTRMIVQHSSWQLRHDFLHMIETVLSLIPPRFAYYPGAVEQYDQFLSAHPEAKLYGLRQGGKLPWALISGLDPNTEGEICFKKESFCPIIAETALEASSAADFIDRAVDFANRRLWGTLTATIIVHPRSLEDTAVSSALDRALDNLRYGVIAVNCTPGLAWVMTVPPWGSFPNNSPWNIQSGTGFVHNSFMFSRPQKTVLRAPFRTWPHPVWFPSRATSFSEVTRKIVKYEREPSWWLVPGILWAGLR
jgi:acyl-CoA reductase-like NAD-dependent aldehyde dehydrogenase